MWPLCRCRPQGAWELAGQGLRLPSSPAQCRPRAGRPLADVAWTLSLSRKAASEAEEHRTECAGSSSHGTSRLQAAGERVPDYKGLPPSPGPPARSPILLGVIDYGPDLQLPIDLRPPIFLQFHLLERKGKAVSPSTRAGRPNFAPTRRGRVAGRHPSVYGSRRHGRQTRAKQACGCWLGWGAGRGRRGRRGGGRAVPQARRALPSALREQGAIDGVGHGNRPPLCGAQSRALVGRASRTTLGNPAEENKQGLSDGGRAGQGACQRGVLHGTGFESNPALVCWDFSRARLSPCSDSEKARLDALPACLAKRPSTRTGKGRRECSSTLTGPGRGAMMDGSQRLSEFSELRRSCRAKAERSTVLESRVVGWAPRPDARLWAPRLLHPRVVDSAETRALSMRPAPGTGPHLFATTVSFLLLKEHDYS